MDQLNDLQLKDALSSGLRNYGVTDNVLQDEAVSNVLMQMVDMWNKATSQIISKQNELQQETSQAVKIGGALTDAVKDTLGPTPVPQQDMNTSEEPAPAPQEQPTPDMTPPPEMNVPPAPDMGAVPNMNAQPAPDAGMMPPPDMTQISPDMLGAIQPRY